jgi:flagellar basal body-associated protein FliL
MPISLVWVSAFARAFEELKSTGRHTMSDKAKKDDGKKDEKAGEGKKGGGIIAMLTKLPVLVGGAMFLQSIILIGAFKMLGGGAAPASADTTIHTEEAAKGAAEGSHGDAAKTEGGKDEEGGATAAVKKDWAEISIVEFRAPNKLSGKTYIYDVIIIASVKGEKEEKAKAAIEQRKALIADRVRTIIAQSDPEKLGGGSEPGLETLRRQVKFQLDELLGPGLIDEVLVPRCIPFRADF